jgi:hypothetical protein
MMTREKQFMEITGVEVPKRTIHSLRPRRLEANSRRNSKATLFIEREEQPAMILVSLLADGTKTHSIYETNNDVTVAIKYDESTKEKRLLSIRVNNGWGDAKGKTTESTVIVSDAEEGNPSKHSSFRFAARPRACCERQPLPDVDGRGKQGRAG